MLKSALFSMTHTTSNKSLNFKDKRRKQDKNKNSNSVVDCKNSDVNTQYIKAFISNKKELSVISLNDNSVTEYLFGDESDSFVNNHGYVVSCYFDLISNIIVIKSKDNSITLFKLSSKEKNDINKSLYFQWTHEEALANPISARLLDETKEDSICTSEEECTCENVYHREFPNFFKRLA